MFQLSMLWRSVDWANADP